MDQQKSDFLRYTQFELLKKLTSSTTATWGKMDAQQMVEHVSGFFKVSNGKLTFPLVTPEAHLPKYKEFLLSDAVFRENTKAPAGIIPDDPLPVYYPDLPTAIGQLQQEVESFYHYFEKEQEMTQHPVFGHLNFDEWILLHYKHVQHHLKQFGLV